MNEAKKLELLRKAKSLFAEGLAIIESREEELAKRVSSVASDLQKRDDLNKAVQDDVAVIKTLQSLGPDTLRKFDPQTKATVRTQMLAARKRIEDLFGTDDAAQTYRDECIATIDGVLALLDCEQVEPVATAKAAKNDRDAAAAMAKTIHSQGGFDVARAMFPTTSTNAAEPSDVEKQIKEAHRTGRIRTEDLLTY